MFSIQEHILVSQYSLFSILILFHECNNFTYLSEDIDYVHVHMCVRERKREVFLSFHGSVFP